MNKNNIDYLKLHVHHWHSLRHEGYIRNVSGETAKELLRIAQEEFDARYLVCLRQPQGVCELIRYVYGLAAAFIHGEGAETETVVTAVIESGAKEEPVQLYEVSGKAHRQKVMKMEKTKCSNRRKQWP